MAVLDPLIAVMNNICISLSPNSDVPFATQNSQINWTLRQKKTPYFQWDPGVRKTQLPALLTPVHPRKQIAWEGDIPQTHTQTHFATTRPTRPRGPSW